MRSPVHPLPVHPSPVHPSLVRPAVRWLACSLAAVFLLAGCAEEPEPADAEGEVDSGQTAEATPMADPVEANVALVRDAYDSFAQGDVEAVLAVMDPEVHWVEAEGHPYGGTYTGPDEVNENIFQRLGTEWSEFHVVPTEFVADGEVVVAIGEYSGTHAETGKSFTTDFAHVFRIQDGRVVEFRQFTDTEPWARAAGM